MALNTQVKDEITSIIYDGLKEKIKNYQKAEDMEKPFYYSLFTTKTVDLAAILQSAYTWFGSQWEKIAKIIATHNTDKFSTAQTRYRLYGKITREEESTIGQILRELDRRKNRSANIISEKEEIIKSYSQEDSTEDYDEEIDLFIKTKDNKEIYFELKSAKPNKNEIRAAKNDLLHVLAMRQKDVPLDDVSIYLALPYNQYNGEYDRWTVCRFFTLKKDLLVGKDFWDFLGGNNTYEELLALFNEIGDQIKDTLEETIQLKQNAKRLKETNMDDF